MQETELTMNSLDGMQRASMPDALRGKIADTLSAAGKARTIRLGWHSILLAAAGLALLTALNIFSVSTFTPGTDQAQAAPKGNPLSEEYFRPAPSI